MSYSVEILREFTRFLDKSAVLNTAQTTSTSLPPPPVAGAAPASVAIQGLPQSTPNDDAAKLNVQSQSTPPPKSPSALKDNQFVEPKTQK